MPGFEFVMSMGAPLREFDVVLTADVVPVITHNHRLYARTFRTDDGALLTEELRMVVVTWEALHSYEIGHLDGASDYGQRFPDQAQIDELRVPRLSDLLESAAQPRFQGANLMLEFKSDPVLADVPDSRRRFVENFLDEVRASRLDKRTLLHSFYGGLLAKCQRQVLDLPTSCLTQMPETEEAKGEDSAQSVSPDFTGRRNRVPDMMAEAGGMIWFPFVRDIDAPLMSRARELDLFVAVWTVSSLEDIDWMNDLRVDAIDSY